MLSSSLFTQYALCDSQAHKAGLNAPVWSVVMTEERGTIRGMLGDEQV